jgi:hypothetical protein
MAGAFRGPQIESSASMLSLWKSKFQQVEIHDRAQPHPNHTNYLLATFECHLEALLVVMWLMLPDVDERLEAEQMVSKLIAKGASGELDSHRKAV